MTWGSWDFMLAGDWSGVRQKEHWSGIGLGVAEVGECMAASARLLVSSSTAGSVMGRRRRSGSRQVVVLAGVGPFGFGR